MINSISGVVAVPTTRFLATMNGIKSSRNSTCAMQETGGLSTQSGSSSTCELVFAGDVSAMGEIDMELGCVRHYLLAMSSSMGVIDVEL